MLQRNWKQPSNESDRKVIEARPARSFLLLAHTTSIVRFASAYKFWRFQDGFLLIWHASPGRIISSAGY